LMSAVDERSSFPTECKLAFGSSDKKQHTNLLKWTATIFRTRAIAAEWTTEYMPTPEERDQAKEDEFVKKRIFIAMDERSKLMTEWKTLKPK